MQIMVVKWDPRTCPRGDSPRHVATALARAKHGSVIIVPDWIELEVLEISSDEEGLPFVLEMDGDTVRIVRKD